jgi:hypothetical protein
MTTELHLPELRASHRSAAAKPAPSLTGAPPEYAMPEERPSLEWAQAWCHQLATSHYENFHVATFFLPKRVRPHFESLYAFCRISDDLGDEVGSTTTSATTLRTSRGIPSSLPSARPSKPATFRARCSMTSFAPSSRTRSRPSTTPGMKPSTTPATPPIPSAASS